MTISRCTLVLLVGSMALLAADPFAGTWKANIERSKLTKPFNEGYGILKFEVVGKNQYRVTRSKTDGSVVIGKDSKPVPAFDIILDGKERHDLDSTNSSTRVDDRHFRNVAKGPSGTVSEEFAVSADGKYLFMTRKGTGTHTGRLVDEVLAYDRK